MPWKPTSVGKRSFYLDQSTLSDAYKSLRLEAPTREREYLPLVDWVRRVAHEANLCISWPHVYELAAWDGPEAGAMAQWLDELPLVWVNQAPRVTRSELECGLRREAGLPESLPEPFASSYLATYESLELDALCQFLGHTSLPEIVRMARNASPTRWRDQSLKYARMLHDDRKQSAWHPNFARQFLNARERERLRKVLQRMLDGLGIDKHGHSARDRFNIVDATLKRIVAHPQEYRCYHTTQLLAFEFAHRSAVVTPGTKRFNAMGSSGLDMQHAAPASYCDVFTCDMLTSSWLSDVRASLYGLPRQFARGEYPSSEAFVNALLAAGP